MEKAAYGVNSFSYMWTHPVLECVSGLARMGFDEFELMTMPGHLWPDEIDAQARRDLLARFGDLGVRVRSLNHTSLDQNLCSALPEIRAYTIGLGRKLIGLARDLRARHVVVVPGRINPLLPAPGSRHLDWLFESLVQLKAIAEDNGVILAIENIPIGPLPRIEQVVEMVKRLDSPAVRICYDVANGHFAGEDPVAGLKAAAPWLDVVHLSDTTRRVWRHDAIGDGDVDFVSILRCLSAIAHAPKPLIELCVANPDAALTTTLGSLARLGRG